MIGINRRKWFVVGSIAVMLVTVIIFAQIKKRAEGKRLYERFFFSDLKGKLNSVQVSVGIVYFKLDDGNEYAFSPVTSKKNDLNIFNYVAQRGDSVIKPSKSHTLKLIKQDGREYIYTFSEHK